MKKPNQYSDNMSSRFELTQGFFAIVDTEDLEKLSHFKWRAHKAHNKWYAVAWKFSNGKRFILYMHRFVAHTPRNMIGHHKNSNSLDNRKVNLTNMTLEDHKFFHMHTQIQIKKVETPPEQQQRGGNSVEIA